MELNLYSECEVDFLDEYQKIAEDVLSHVLQRYACPFSVQVSLYIVTPEEIKEANAQTRQIDKVTDVLSFPNLFFAYSNHLTMSYFSRLPKVML